MKLTNYSGFYDKKKKNGIGVFRVVVKLTLDIAGNFSIYGIRPNTDLKMRIGQDPTGS